MSDTLQAPELTLPAPVLLVEDEPLVCRRLEGLLLQLGYQRDALVYAGSLAEARACLANQPVALALVDLGLPDGSGIDLIAEMHAADPGLAILVISAWCTEDAILAALRAGATGYVLKERDDIEVALSLRSVLRGGAPIDPFVARRIIEELRPRPAEQPGTPSGEILSPRESQILRLVAEGLANREIAEQLFLSRYTVECHIKHIYRKLAVSSRTRAVHTARARGLLD
ncbi:MULTISPECIES: response regulator transcription factor [Achromobacter]|jgi:DNA-binding NarL/FixJ family response regulator|uniref:response regulator transcription factor n=1 Tax=Achromobacter TaxID=222 RepID=UPI0028583930|nr:response regulator transcription factor [Achromobacter deleyi]MDR6601657.1 DNA-binding NarL/FixJ family response regulator [Achromobacter deleyi]